MDTSFHHLHPLMRVGHGGDGEDNYGWRGSNTESPDFKVHGEPDFNGGSEFRFPHFASSLTSAGRRQSTKPRAPETRWNVRARPCP